MSKIDIINKLWIIAKSHTLELFYLKIKQGNKEYENLLDEFLKYFDLIEFEYFFKLAKTTKSIAATLKFMRFKVKQYISINQGYENDYIDIRDENFTNKFVVEFNFEEINAKYILENFISRKDVEFFMKYIIDGRKLENKDYVRYHRLKKKYFYLKQILCV